jgi:hypothetical protein
LRAALEHIGGRLDQIEERLHALECLAFEVGALEDRLAELERRAMLPSSADLQERRYAAVRRLRAEGFGVTAIAERTGMSRSRVGTLVATLPLPEVVTSTNGTSYPARKATTARRRSKAASPRA